MGRRTSLHQVEGSVLTLIRLCANFCKFFDQIFHHCNWRHQDMAEDLRLRPEWNQYTPQYSIFLRDAVMAWCLIDIDIFQNHLINIDIDIDIFGIALSISIFSTSPYRYRYRYRYFSKVSIYRQSIFHIDILTRRRSKKTFFTGVHGEGVIKCVLQGQKNAFFITFS